MSPLSRLDWNEFGRATVETVRSPLLVLDEEFRIQSANPVIGVLNEELGIG